MKKKKKNIKRITIPLMRSHFNAYRREKKENLSLDRRIQRIHSTTTTTKERKQLTISLSYQMI